MANFARTTFPNIKKKRDDVMGFRVWCAMFIARHIHTFALETFVRAVVVVMGGREGGREGGELRGAGDVRGSVHTVS